MPSGIFEKLGNLYTFDIFLVGLDGCIAKKGEKFMQRGEFMSF